MEGRGASAGDTNSRILSKIVSLENKRNEGNTRIGTLEEKRGKFRIKR